MNAEIVNNNKKNSVKNFGYNQNQKSSQSHPLLYYMYYSIAQDWYKIQTLIKNVIGELLVPNRNK